MPGYILWHGFCYKEMCDLAEKDACYRAEFSCWDPDGLRADWEKTTCADDVIDYCCKFGTNCTQFTTLDYGRCEELEVPIPTEGRFGNYLLLVEILFDKDVWLSVPSECDQIFTPNSSELLGESPVCMYNENKMAIVLGSKARLSVGDVLFFNEVLLAYNKDAWYPGSGNVTIEAPENNLFSFNSALDIQEEVESCVDYPLQLWVKQGTLTRYYSFFWKVTYLPSNLTFSYEETSFGRSEVILAQEDLASNDLV
jgi:hypothetical protein